MRPLNQSILFLGFTIVVAACSKEPESNQNNEDLLTNQPWVIQKAEAKTNSNPWGDSFPSWQACKKDDKWIFKTDNSLEINEAPNACSGSSPNSILDIITWALSDNETKLTIDGAIMTIEQLDNATLVISASEVISGTTYYSKYTLGH